METIQHAVILGKCIVCGATKQGLAGEFMASSWRMVSGPYIWGHPSTEVTCSPQCYATDEKRRVLEEINREYQRVLPLIEQAKAVLKGHKSKAEVIKAYEALLDIMAPEVCDRRDCSDYE